MLHNKIVIAEKMEGRLKIHFLVTWYIFLQKSKDYITLYYFKDIQAHCKRSDSGRRKKNILRNKIKTMSEDKSDAD